MSHISKEEYLSAFLDGESGSFEQQRLSDQLGADDLMQDKLSNFALIGETMRHQVQSTIAEPAFLAGIQGAIADEKYSIELEQKAPFTSIDEKIERKRLFPRQFVGYAAAASFAAIATVSLQNFFNSVPSTPTIVAKTMIEPVVSRASVAQVALMPSVVDERRPVVHAVNYAVPDAETRNLMNQYVAHHFQYASSSTLMPRVRAVSYSTDF